MLTKAVRQDRGERKLAAYPLGYVEDLNDARTPLPDFFYASCEDNRSAPYRIAGRDKVEIQPVRIAPFSPVLRFPRHCLWR